MAKMDQYVVGIDIGSSKIAVLIGQRPEPGASSTSKHALEVVGRGSAPNRGTRKGAIVNVEATVEALKIATEEAEVMAGVEIARAYVGVAGADIRSVNARGMVSVARKDREITPSGHRTGAGGGDVPRRCPRIARFCTPSRRSSWSTSRAGSATRSACSVRRLEVTLHLVTGHTTRGKTLLTCVNRAGIEVVEMVFEPLATAEAVLTPDEREHGALLIDIGAGTTGVRALPGRRDPLERGGADRRRPLHQRPGDGAAHAVRRGRADQVQARLLPGQPGHRRRGRSRCRRWAAALPRVVPRRELCEILQPRAEELFNLLRAGPA